MRRTRAIHSLSACAAARRISISSARACSKDGGVTRSSSVLAAAAQRRLAAHIAAGRGMLRAITAVKDAAPARAARAATKAAAGASEASSQVLVCSPH